MPHLLAWPISLRALGPCGIESWGFPGILLIGQIELALRHGAYFYLKGPFSQRCPRTLLGTTRYTPREIYRWGILRRTRRCRRRMASNSPTFLLADQETSFAQMMER